MKEDKLLNNSGASLIEIVAAIVILSITSLIIINMLFTNMKQDQINQERALMTNIANSTLQYVLNRDYDTIDDYMGEAEYVKINDDNCNDLFLNDYEICKTILAPEINNRVYDKEHLTIYVFPYNDEADINWLKIDYPDTFPEILVKYIEKMNYKTTLDSELDNHMIRLIVVIESENSRTGDVLLEGVIKDEDFK